MKQIMEQQLLHDLDENKKRCGESNNARIEIVENLVQTLLNDLELTVN